MKIKKLLYTLAEDGIMFTFSTKKIKCDIVKYTFKNDNVNYSITSDELMYYSIENLVDMIRCGLKIA